MQPQSQSQPPPSTNGSINKSITVTAEFKRGVSEFMDGKKTESNQ